MRVGVVYTCLTGKYDILINHQYVDKSWDYICFTDDEELIRAKKHGIWQIRPLVYSQKNNALNNRYHKINPHKILMEYDESIYVDGNVDICSSYLFKEIKKRKLDLLVPIHFCRNCVYEEFQKVKEYEYDKPEVLRRHIDLIKKEGFPKFFGLGENNVLYRKHKTAEVMKIMDEWWFLLENHSCRDQLSFVFVLWKNGYDIKNHFIKNARFSPKDFNVTSHNPKILITGGAGFIGSSVADRMLKKNYKVVVVDNFNDYYDEKVKLRNIDSALKNNHYKLYRGIFATKNFWRRFFQKINLIW